MTTLAFPSPRLKCSQKQISFTIKWLSLFVLFLTTLAFCLIIAVGTQMFCLYIVTEANSRARLQHSSYVVSSFAAKRLPRAGTLFCWVLTSPQYFQTRVPAVNETWLKRCDHGQFFTTESIGDETIPFTTVFSGLDDSYHQLFYKTMRGFYYSYQYISKDFDWYMKADDDAYVIVEHLLDYLAEFNASKPYYLGYRFKPFLENGYNSGGAGYILSNGAVKLFVEKLYYNRTLCPFDMFEDIGLGRCLESLGVYPLDTRNSNEQHRFLPNSITKHYEMMVDDPQYIMWPEKKKYEAFAPELITMHHQTPEEIRMIEILLYSVKNPQMSKFHQK